jgi:ribonuclease P protein component
LQTKAFLPPSSDFTFKKPERLCSKKAFEFLFSNGKTVFVHPLKIIYAHQITENPGLVQVAFGVSKRNFKRANKRNRIKRLLREVYRRNKLHPKNQNLSIMIMYISKEIDNYSVIEASLIKALNLITVKVEKNS